MVMPVGPRLLGRSLVVVRGLYLWQMFKTDSLYISLTTGHWLAAPVDRGGDDDEHKVVVKTARNKKVLSHLYRNY